MDINSVQRSNLVDNNQLQRKSGENTSKAYNEKVKDEINADQDKLSLESSVKQKPATYDKKLERQRYLEKARQMQEETQRRMAELFGTTTEKTFLKQNGGLRATIQRIINGEGEYTDFSLDPTKIQEARESIEPGGYWSVEATSDRLIDFAKAVSANDPKQADALIGAFKKGYEAAEKIWGGSLPEISQKTYNRTLEKFEEWKNS